jgi:hypothetical protein
MVDLGVLVVGWRGWARAIKLHISTGLRAASSSLAPALNSLLDFGPMGPMGAALNLRATSETPIRQSLSTVGGGGAADVIGQAAQAPRQHSARRGRHG